MSLLKTAAVSVGVCAVALNYWVLPKIDSVTPWEGLLPFAPIGCGAPAAPEATGFPALFHDLGTGIRSLASGPPSAQQIRGWLSSAGEGGAMAVHFASGGLEGKPKPLGLAPSPPPQAPLAVAAPGRLSEPKIATLAVQAGWPAAEVPNVVARVMAESTGDPRAQDYADGTHHGLLQLGAAERARYIPGQDAFDPLVNLKGAKLLWDERGWQPWRASDSAVAAQPASAVAPVDCGSLVAAEGSPVEGLDPVTLPARSAVLAAFGPMTVGGWGTRPNATEHDEMINGQKASRALDFMVEGPKGDAISQYLIDHAAILRVEYLIWDRRIWSPGRGWRSYSGASPHTDHVHLTVLPGGEVPRLAG